MKALEKELDDLLGILCAEWGFCLSVEQARPICEPESITDAEFAGAVLIAAGFVPPEYSAFYKPLKRRFRRHFGATSLRARDLER